MTTSPLPGPSGNIEYFLWLRRLPAALTGDDIGAEVVVGEERDRQATGPDGQEGYRADAVVCLRRPPAAV